MPAPSRTAVELRQQGGVDVDLLVGVLGGARLFTDAARHMQHDSVHRNWLPRFDALLGVSISGQHEDAAAVPGLDPEPEIPGGYAAHRDAIQIHLPADE